MTTKLLTSQDLSERLLLSPAITKIQRISKLVSDAPLKTEYQPPIEIYGYSQEGKLELSCKFPRGKDNSIEAELVDVILASGFKEIPNGRYFFNDMETKVFKSLYAKEETP